MGTIAWVVARVQESELSMVSPELVMRHRACGWLTATLALGLGIAAPGCEKKNGAKRLDSMYVVAGPRAFLVIDIDYEALRRAAIFDSVEDWVGNAKDAESLGPIAGVEATEWFARVKRFMEAVDLQDEDVQGYALAFSLDEEDPLEWWFIPTMAVRLSKPIAPDKFRKALSALLADEAEISVVDREDSRVFRFEPLETVVRHRMAGTPAVALSPRRNVVLFGLERRIVRALRRVRSVAGPSEELLAARESVVAGSQVFAALVLTGVVRQKVLENMPSGEQTGGEEDVFEKAAKMIESLRSAALAVRFDEGITICFAAVTSEDDVTVKGLLEDRFLTWAREKIDESGEKELLPFLDRIKIEAVDCEVTARLRLSEADIEALRQMAESREHTSD